MSSLILVSLLQVSLTAAGAETYTEAHRVASETGKPIVIMVSTEWCPPCQTMKKTVIPQVRKQGLFSRVAYCVVDPDHQSDLARQVTGGGPVPQLVMFRKTPRGWMRRKLIGGQSVDTVEQFINQGLAQDADAKKAAPDGQQPTPAHPVSAKNAATP